MAGEKYIALEETSQAIKEAVEGVKTDVAGVKTDVGNVDTNVDGVKTDTENIINKLSGGSGTIRHIQRGLATFKKMSDNTATIALSGFTDINKMIVIVTGSINSNEVSYTPYINSFSLNELVMKTSYVGQESTVSYQVIEFY